MSFFPLNKQTDKNDPFLIPLKERSELIEDHFKYQNYLISESWRLIARERAKKDNFNCVMCKSPNKLITHHLTYKRLYNETLYDLVTLCSRCHLRIHRISPPKDTPKFVKNNFWSIISEVTPEYLVNKMYDF